MTAMRAHSTEDPAGPVTPVELFFDVVFVRLAPFNSGQFPFRTCT